jgi:hypothetical protein
MKILNTYYYLFYWIYKMTYRTNKDIIEWSSMIALSVLLYLNITSLIIFLIPKEVVILYKYEVFYGIGLLILIINFFIFIKDRKYLRIVERFKTENKNNFYIKSIFILAYIFLSVYFTIYLIKYHWEYLLINPICLS